MAVAVTREGERRSEPHVGTKRENKREKKREKKAKKSEKKEEDRAQESPPPGSDAADKRRNKGRHKKDKRRKHEAARPLLADHAHVRTTVRTGHEHDGAPSWAGAEGREDVQIDTQRPTWDYYQKA